MGTDVCEERNKTSYLSSDFVYWISQFSLLQSGKKENQKLQKREKTGTKFTTSPQFLQGQLSPNAQ